MAADKNTLQEVDLQPALPISGYYRKDLAYDG